NWKELLRIEAETVVFKDTDVYFRWTDPKVDSRFTAERLAITQKNDSAGPYYHLALRLKDIRSELPQAWRMPRSLQSLEAVVAVRESGTEIERIQVLADQIDLSLTGSIEGNLLDPQELKLTSQLDLKGDLKSLADLFQVKEPISG